MNCNFYEGIDTCKEQKCDKNIMGMCTKKGSKNYPNVPHRTYFEKLKLMNIDELAKQLAINELNTILLDKNKSKEEKNTAYESLKSINETKGLEEQIETMLKDEFKYDSFVKISKDQINIVISSSEHNKDIANNIIKKVQSMYNTKKYITIKFQ